MKVNRASPCSEFEERLSDYVAGRLPASLRKKLELHLDGCQSCSGLKATASGAFDLPNDNTLVDDVLRRTSGSSCTELDGLISGFQNETLEPGECDLVREHLDHCPGCSAIAFTLGEIGELLPELAAVDPGADFLGRVIGATSMAGERGSRLDRVLEQLLQAFRSPRFSWEAAYLGSLILFGLFALAGHFLDRSTVTFVPTQSSVTVSVKSQLDPLIQAGGAGVEDAENVLRSLARSASKTGNSFLSAARTHGRQAVEGASTRLTLIRHQLGESAGEGADWIESLWIRLSQDKPRS